MNAHAEMNHQYSDLLPDGRGLKHDLVVYEAGKNCKAVIGNAICGWPYWSLLYAFMSFCSSFFAFLIWMAQNKKGGSFSMAIAICAMIAFSLCAASIIFYFARRYRRWKASHIGVVAEFRADTGMIVFPDGWVVDRNDVLGIHLLRTGYADLDSLGNGAYCSVHQVQVLMRSDPSVSTPETDAIVRRAVLTVNGFGWHTCRAFRMFCEEVGLSLFTTRVRRSRWPLGSDVARIVDIPMF